MSTTAIVATETPIASTSTSVQNSIASSAKSTKRKFDDALLSLDEAIRPLGEYESSSNAANSSPSKRVRLTRSIYSTLAKYGIGNSPAKSKSTLDNDVMSAAPRFAAILARTASKTRNAFPFKISTGLFSDESSAPDSPGSKSSLTSEYSPSSTKSFLARLSTFKLSTYSNKPAAIDAVAAAKCGWVNEGGKDRLVCGICHASWVVAGKEGLNKDAANTLLERQRVQLVSAHKDGCRWKIRQCDPNIFRIPLKPPAALAKEIKLLALQMNDVLDGVDIKHPLTSNHVQSLMSTISSIKLYLSASSATDNISSENTDQSDHTIMDTRQPSETSVLVALFGWTFVTTSTSRTSSGVQNTISRASSVAPGSSAAKSSPLVRVRLPSFSRDGSPALDMQTSPARQSDSKVLQCILCQRRVGLWAFYEGAASNSHANASSNSEITSTPGSRPTPKRQFDLLKEHRSYCPYIIRSTMVPSLPTPLSRSRSLNRSRSASNTAPSSPQSQTLSNSDLVEGWRAVLTIILRHGLRQKQLQRAFSRRSNAVVGNTTENLNPSEQNTDEPNELDDIQSMVDDVKSHGGKNLLSYVRNLLT